MKPITNLRITHRLARHRYSASNERAFPATDYFFRPQPEDTLGRAGRGLSDRGSSAFRRMTREMLAAHRKDEPLEMIVLAFVTAIVAWPLISLLVVLAQTAHS